MVHQKHDEDKRDYSDQAAVIEYSLDELLANSPKEAFQLSREDKRWLAGPLTEKFSRD